MRNQSIIYFIGLIIFLISCSTSMTPMEVNKSLPSLTKSKFISQSEVGEMIKIKNCKYLVLNRSYAAPMGLSTMDDLRNGAKGIDEWVEIDKGNAYVLKNFKWVNVGDQGGTQLNIEFDTMLCEL